MSAETTGGVRPFDEEEIIILRKMLIEHEHSAEDRRDSKKMLEDWRRGKWFRSQAKYWLAWGFGAPVAAVGAWKSLETIFSQIIGRH